MQRPAKPWTPVRFRPPPIQPYYEEDVIDRCLYDEIDTLFGPKAKDNEEVRGLINGGHRRGATAGRCVVRGKLIETEELPAYGAVALAGLGNLPDTIMVLI